MKNTVTIHYVSIKSFRNLVDVSFDIHGESVAFSGINALGKTNVLNAIMWCLTGYDIEDKSKDIDNVPNIVLRNGLDDPVACDVEVVLNVGTVRRVMSYIDGTCKKTLFIDGIECSSIKNGEIAIDKMLGILELTIGADKDFNVRRFLLNPLYTTTCKESAFRNFVTSKLKVNLEHIYNLLPASHRALLDSRAITYNYSISKMSYDKDIRKVKDESKSWSSICDYLSKYIGAGVDDSVLASAKSLWTECNKRLGDLQMHQAALDEYAVAAGRAYNVACLTTFTHTNMVMIEKGQGDDVWKEVCHPTIRGRSYSFTQGSTSERIMTGCYMVGDFWSILGIPSLPMIFDECETLDKCSLALLSHKVGTQLLTAKVNDDYDFINMEVIK